MSARILGIAAVLAAAALLPACPSAAAAPARTGSLSLAGPAFAWDGGPVSGLAVTGEVGTAAPCTPGVNECDDTLLKVVDGGDVTVAITGTNATAVDLDLYVYHSDEKGTVGTFVSSSTGSTADEHVDFTAEPGFYLARVLAATASNATYKGTAKIMPSPPLPPPPGASLDRPTTASSGAAAAGVHAAFSLPRTGARIRGGGLRGLRGTASADAGSVVRVEVALVRIAGGRCAGMTSRGRFKRLRSCDAPRFLRAQGTTRWSFAFPRRLPRGAYVAYARATDDQGRTETGVGPRNSVQFRVS